MKSITKDGFDKDMLSGVNTSNEITSVAGTAGRERLLEDIIANSPYLTLAAGEDGRVIFAGLDTKLIFGQVSAALIGKPIAELFDDCRGGETTAEIMRALGEAGKWRGEIHLILEGKQRRVVNCLAIRNKQYAAQNSYFDLFFLKDITEFIRQQRQERQQESVATRAEMAGEISHELNNYLAIAMGNLELISMAIERGKFDGLGPRAKSMKDGLTRIARFVEGLMSIARQEPRREPIDLHQFLDEQIFFQKQESAYKDIEFINHWGDGIPAIEGDKGRLQQALINIFSNSLDALARTEKKIITIATSRSETEGFIRLTISDNGCGMSQEEYQKVFRQYFTTKGPGHGFGLLAVKGMIKSQGGKVSAGPGPDGGASFTIELPLKSTAPNTKPAAVVA